MKDPTEAMTKQKALMHWSGSPKPWHYKGRRQNLPRGLPHIEPKDIDIDQNGNVRSMPLLVGVPCFGLPFPRLRYAGRWGKDRQGKRFPTRCVNCKVAEACQTVVDARVSRSPELVRLTFEYRTALIASGFQDEVVRGRTTKLRTELEKYLWLNANDSAASDEHARLQLERLKSDAARKKLSRREPASGALLEAYIGVALVEFNKRLGVLGRYLRSPQCLKIHRQIDAVMDTRVWFVRDILRWQKIEPTAAKVANELRARKLSDRSYDALRAKVVTNLKRVQTWETETLPGQTAPIWRAFDPANPPVS